MPSLIVPWRGGCAFRERALEWVAARLAADHPAWQVTIAPAPEGEWVKALAVNRAIRASRAEVVVVHDADVWCDGVTEAVEAVERGEPWAMPHGTVRRLTRQSTDRLLAGGDPDGLPLEEKAYPGRWGGGIVATSRATAVEVPLDPRFVGWGREDQCWAIALYHLAGPGWRGNRPLWHLWHPAQQRITRGRARPASEELFRRYTRARHSPALMRSLLDEVADVAHQPDQPAVRDRAPVGV